MYTGGERNWRKSSTFAGDAPTVHTPPRTELDVNIAASVGDLECLQLCYELGQELVADEGDELKRTPMHWAALGGHIECAQWLHEQDQGMVRSTAAHGWEPLHAASAGTT